MKIRGDKWKQIAAALPILALLFGAVGSTTVTQAGNGQALPVSSSPQTELSPSAPSNLLNISTRARVLTGENVLIGGFIITGTDAKTVIIRGIGPSLAQFLAGALADPTLELFQGNTLLESNDNWKDNNRAAIEATGIPPSNDLEPAIVRTLAPGAYTAILRGKGNTTGIALVEAYDLDQATNSKLANIATRGFVDTGDNVMIGGLIVGPVGAASAKVVVRAPGPTLANFGVAGALQDPILELYNGNGTAIASNDNWKTRPDGSSQQVEIEATGLQLSDDREPALVQMLDPGNYTAIVRGNQNGTGVALVEVYHVVNVVVPDVTGLAQNAATTILNTVGLAAGAVTQESSSTVPAGNIIRQMPLPGTSVSLGSAVDLVVSIGPIPLPPDPGTIAPPFDPGGGTDIGTATEFLYKGPNPIQTGVVPGTIDRTRAAVLRGKVLQRDGTVISGVKISVLAHPEFGQTLSRADGAFDLAVNGGGQLTVKYEQTGYIPVQRSVNAPWRDYVTLPDVVLIPYDTAVTTVTVNASSMQVARGSAISDADGSRRATVVIPAGTGADMVMNDGSHVVLTTMHMRATEYTVGPSGPKAMPAALPPSSGYTYCVEFSLDEAVNAGAASVQFSQPMPIYAENFLGFPVGSAVPTGFYDRQKGQWVASTNGRVIKVLSITANVADLDTDGDGNADDTTKLAPLAITTEERTRLAQLYAAGQTLWRVPLTHFSPWDCNWPYGPPSNASGPPGQGQNNPPIDSPKGECGSIIGCEDQTLGESLPVVGMPWQLYYKSDRTPGRKEAYSLTIPVSGPAALPAGLRTMRVKAVIAGREYLRTFTPASNLSAVIDWDGKDAYGRAVSSSATASVTVEYEYGAVYYAVRSDRNNAFARAEQSGAAVTASRTFGTVSLSEHWTQQVGSFDARVLGLNGWSLDIQHAYDPDSHILLLGNGQQRRADALPAIIDTIAGNGTTTPFGDGGLATAAGLDSPTGIAVAPDGTVFLAQSAPSNCRIRRIGRDGIITTVAGTGPGGFSGDGGPATAAQLNSPQSVAVTPDGSLIIGESARIRRVGPDGIITTLAGNGTGGFSGDGGPAVAARILTPGAITVGGDGSIYFADGGLGDGSNNRVRRIGTDGIITTVAGGGSGGDGGPATAAVLRNPIGVAVGEDGTLFIVTSIDSRVRRVAPDGIITTVAGNGTSGYGGDGGAAILAQLNAPRRIALGADGSLFIADYLNNRVRQVTPTGTIVTIAGNGTQPFTGDRGSAPAAGVYRPLDVAVGTNGSLLILDTNRRIRRTLNAFPEFAPTDVIISSEDGREVYVFNSIGRHLKTLDALTGATRYQFGYDAAGYPTSVTDESGNVTAIERNGRIASAIVASGGQRSVLTADANGWLASLANPANEKHTMTYSADGLLQTFTDPRSNVHRFSYDGGGRLTKDENPAGGSTSLTRAEQTNGYSVTTTSALGRTHLYEVELLSTGEIRRTTVSTSGATTVTLIDPNKDEQTSFATADTLSIQYGPDPRWGMLARVPKNVVTKTPAGLTRTVTTSRTATLSDSANPFSLTKLAETITENGAPRTETYDGPTRVITSKSAVGRTSTVKFDSLARVIQSQIAGLDAVNYVYDSLGRVSSITQGSGVAAHNASFAYNTKNELISFQDALSHTVGFNYDLAERVTSQVLPDNTAIGFSYDTNGNLASITPPSKPAHNFGYTPIDFVQSYTPPDIGIGDTATRYTYNADRMPTRVTRPDATVVDFNYDAAGRLTGVALPRGTIASSYDSADRLASRTAPGGLGLTYTYDGSLLTGETRTGAVAGSVSGTYDARFRLISTAVNSANTISLSYDADNLITQAGSLTLARNAQNGLITATTLGAVTDSRTYNTFGELTGYTATVSGSSQFSVQYTRDALGRITSKTETIVGRTDSYAYSYDLVGRLTAVQKNGAAFESYSYDPNGNRLNGTVSGVQKNGSYNAQDRLQQYGATTYSYGAAGELKAKTAGGQTTSYSYDQLGNLISVALPNGQSIEYLIDAENRRVGKKINGTIGQGFLYQNQLAPIAELDGSGNIVSRFVYATHRNAPEYMVKAGATYRIITDQLGSPRLVVNTSSGAIAQRVDYDSFGNVLADTNPGFQPFGFAGGLYDRDTKLVRFGLRDYDSEVGRWIAQDPILFAGNQTNLYAYTANDSVNRLDQKGTSDVPSYSSPFSALDEIGGALGAIAATEAKGTIAGVAETALADTAVPALAGASAGTAAAAAGALVGAGVGGYGAGELADKLYSLGRPKGLGSDLYDLLHPPDDGYVQVQCREKKPFLRWRVPSGR